MACGELTSKSPQPYKRHLSWALVLTSPFGIHVVVALSPVSETPTKEAAEKRSHMSEAHPLQKCVSYPIGLRLPK